MKAYTMIDSNMIVTILMSGKTVYTMTDNVFHSPIQHIATNGILIADGTLILHSDIDDYMWFIDNNTTVSIQ